MANKNIKVKCPICKRYRFVGRAMAYFIRTGKNTGNCRSCSSRGNKRCLGYKHSNVARQNMSDARKGEMPKNFKYFKTFSNNWLGKKLSRKHKQKIGLANKGKVISKEAREKMSTAKMGKKTGVVPRSAFRKGRKMTREQIRKCLRKREMSGLEKRVLHIIEKHNLPYKFVGNGKFFIERKNPDFININGEKKAVEVYWDRHKEQFARGGLNGWKSERVRVFSKYGWQILFIEGTGLTEEKVINVLKGGY